MFYGTLVQDSRKKHAQPERITHQSVTFPASWLGWKHKEFIKMNYATVIEAGTIEILINNRSEQRRYGFYHFQPKFQDGIKILVIHCGEGRIWEPADYRPFTVTPPQRHDTQAYQERPRSAVDQLCIKLWLTTRRICEADYSGSGLQPEEIQRIKDGLGLQPKSDHWR